jgi:hypothetical protein
MQRRFATGLLLTGIGVAVLSWGSLIGYRYDDIKAYCAKRFFETNFVRMIQEQKNCLGIEYNELPQVVLVQGIELDSTTEGDVTLGAYNAGTNKVYISYMDTSTPLLLERVASWYTTGTPKDGIEGVLDHEMGHFYCDKTSEALGNGSFPHAQSEVSPEQHDAEDIVSEGVAEYWEVMNGLRDKFGKVELEILVAQITPATKNLWVVSEAISKYGKTAIEYMVLHPPRETSEIGLMIYRAVVMDGCEKWAMSITE